MKVNPWKGENANFVEILSDLPKIWLIYMLIDEMIYVKKRVKQFMSDTMVGSVIPKNVGNYYASKDITHPSILIKVKRSITFS